MRSFTSRFFVLAAIAATVSFGSAQAAQAQSETINGTMITFPSGRSTRTRTSDFRLIINSQTSPDKAQQFLATLQEGGQDRLMDAIKKEDIGRFSVGPRVGVPINVVYETSEDGKRKIYVLFERWMEFAEIRGGYRSTDYPFGYLELLIDPASGKGEGTYIAAARVRWVQDKKTDNYHIEVENFATWPSRLTFKTDRKVN